MSEIWCKIEEILWIMQMAANNIIFSINTKMSNKMLATKFKVLPNFDQSCDNRHISKHTLISFWYRNNEVFTPQRA